MMNYIQPLFTTGFWFTTVSPPMLPAFYYGFFVFFVLFVVAGILSSKIVKKEKEKFVLRQAAKNMKGWFYAAGITGLTWLFFSYERAVLLSARFWILVWFIGFGVWLVFIIKRIKKLPAKETELKKQADFEKYLPKKR
jgi:hypothetical protein